ncbi:MAG TPA: histidine phosphatase family protein, partial [Oscillatoriaceae cyanobacterium]
MANVLNPMPRNGCELVLVRHGQSTANALGIGQGRADYPLSELGRRQAELTAAHVATLSPVAAVYTSPLSRAAETAAAIARALAHTPRLVDDLVEIDIGALSGHTWDDMRALQPEAFAAYDAAEARGEHPRNNELIPGWEPIHSIVVRVWNAIAAIAGAHAGERVVVVAHGGVLNAFLTQLLDGDACEVPWRHSSTNCAISRLVLAPDGPEALCLTDDRHLAGEAS